MSSSQADSDWGSSFAKPRTWSPASFITQMRVGVATARWQLQCATLIVCLRKTAWPLLR